MWDHLQFAESFVSPAVVLGLLLWDTGVLVELFLGDQVCATGKAVGGTGLSSSDVLLDATLEEMWKITFFAYQESI